MVRVWESRECLKSGGPWTRGGWPVEGGHPVQRTHLLDQAVPGARAATQLPRGEVGAAEEGLRTSGGERRGRDPLKSKPHTPLERGPVSGAGRSHAGSWPPPTLLPRITVLCLHFQLQIWGSGSHGVCCAWGAHPQVGAQLETPGCCPQEPPMPRGVHGPLGGTTARSPVPAALG